MKKILFVAHSPTLEGGGERSLLDMILHTFHSGAHKVSVALPAEGELSQELAKHGIPFHVGFSRFGMYTPHSKGTPEEKWLTIGFADSLIDAYTILLKAQPDLVIVNTVVIPWFVRAAQLFNVPSIVCVRELFDERNGLDLAPSSSEYLSLMARQVDHVFFNSQFTQKSYNDFFQTVSQSIIYPAVDIPTALIKKSEQTTLLDGNNIRILIVGNVAPHKGQLDVVRAFKSLLSKEHAIQASLTIVGSQNNPGYLEEINDEVQSMSDAQVVMKPYTPDPYSEMLAHDVVIMASPNEAFGRVTVEGMLLGRLVIGAKAGGTVDIIDDKKTGFLYRPNDPESLADTLLRVVKHKDEARKVALAGQRHARDTYAKNKIYKEFDTTITNPSLYSKKPNYETARLFGTDTYSLIERNLYVTQKIAEYGAELEASRYARAFSRSIRNPLAGVKMVVKRVKRRI